MKLPNRYKVKDDNIGGGMGDVFECIDKHLDRKVILKLLRAGEDNRRLLDEQKALIRLRSKHVVQLYDIIKVNNPPQIGLILEHIEGYDLKPVTNPQKGLKILWQIACGLTDIHKAEIIHRDIKPNNIRVNSDNFVKIFDFGLSRISGLEAKTRSVIGTPGFMAPELWSWGKVRFDKSIDVYAFGILALSLFRITLPKELLSQPPTSLSTRIPELISILPKEVAKIIERCLSYESKNRPPINEIEKTIRRHLLINQHRGLLVLGNSVHEINHKKSNITVNSGTSNSIGINYDGLRFSVSSLMGNVTVNNMPIQVGNSLPACCVITFAHNGSRTFVTFDVSNPEVTP